MSRSPRGVVATVGAIVASLSLVVAGCSNSSNTVSSGGGAPGVSDTEIDVGSIANVTGPLSSDFAPVVNGVQAYFSMINDQGGVAGRKLKLVAQTDDQGSSSVDLTVAQKLVEQNHVFAIVGVGTPFFGAASYLAHNGTPTFGYVVSSDWANAPGLFGSFGSVLDYATGAPGYAYIAKQLNAQNVGVIAYGVPQSAAACQAAVTGMQGFGIHIAFQDLNFLFGSDPTADVLRMQQNHVDLLLTCIDVTGNVAFARAIQQNGLILHQVWLNGYDRSTLQQYASLVNGTYLLVQHVPFEAATVFPGKYPAIENYIREMQRYQPNHTYDETAMTGWVSADLFVTGLKMVGRNLTQKKLIAALNTLTSYTSNGLQPPIDWTTGHTQALPPYCGAYVQVQGSQFVPVFVQPNNGVFVCFNLQGDTPISPKPGTPGT